MHQNKHLCQQCWGKGKEVVAVHQCQSCKNWFCENHWQLHKAIWGAYWKKRNEQK